MQLLKLKTKLGFAAILLNPLVTGCAPATTTATDTAPIVVKALTPPLPKDCSTDSRIKNKSQAELESMKTQFWIGLHAYRYDTDQNAIDPLSNSAAQMYPPAMYLLSLIYDLHDHVAEAEPLLRCAAQLGFQKAEWDLGRMYAFERSPVRNYPEAFAWLSLAAKHEFAFRDLIEQDIAGVKRRMSSREMRKAEELKVRLLEQMRLVPKFGDDLCCGSGGEPRRE